MNKTALKNFAVWARRDLIKRISDRANLLGVYEGKPIKEIQAKTENGFVVNGLTFNYSVQVREAFIERIAEIGYQETIEEIAYTWFNRFVALRFMEINEYLTNGKNGEKIYIIGSRIDGKTEPDALTNADKLDFVDKIKVYNFQDANEIDALYRYILTAQCNALSEVIPMMFEKISNYEELLLPDHLLDKGAIIDHLVNDISSVDFNINRSDKNSEVSGQVEIVGWLYQFYISEKKDDVFAGLKNNTKISKGTLPAATQIFTPDWIVRYMTDNSLGKMWVESRNSDLKKDLKYYLEPAEQTNEVQTKIDEINKEYAKKKVTEITFIDPCCGSGHILVYAFDIFYKMYLESGYIEAEIPSLILKNNLFGIDVDKRAAQLTSFALTMKAVSYDKDFLSKNVYPNVIDIKESNSIKSQTIEEFLRITKFSKQDEEILRYVVEKFQDAELYGSLIKDFKFTSSQFDVVLQEIKNINEQSLDIYDENKFLNAKPIFCDLLNQAIILSSKYDVVVTNPPYMPTSNNEKIANFAKSYYPDSKTDMFAMFMEISIVKKNGFLAMINMSAWLKLDSYVELRKKKIDTQSFLSIVYLGTSAFEEMKGEVVKTVSFILFNEKINGIKTNAIDLSVLKNKEYSFLNQKLIKNIDVNKFLQLPNFVFDFELSEKFLKIYCNKLLKQDYTTARGFSPKPLENHLRLWFEINKKFIRYTYMSKKEALCEECWVPYNKGGKFRKWYGNIDSVVDFSKCYKHKSENKFSYSNSNYYFLQSVTWPKSSFGRPNFRFNNYGTVIGDVGPCIIGENSIEYILGLLNSTVGKKILLFLNNSQSFQTGDLDNVPIIYSNIGVVTKIVDENINLSKIDWDQYETSWDFTINPLLSIYTKYTNPTEEDEIKKKKILDHYEPNRKYPLNSIFIQYKNQVNERFAKLKQNEEELNKIFIEIYGLQDELTPDVADKDITVARIYDKKEDVPEEMKNNIYVRTKQDVVKDLLSYIVGCAFGRYSPYKEGLIFAGGKFDFNSYSDMSYKHEQDVKEFSSQNRFEPTQENCIVISDNDYGTNDIMPYVIEFLSNCFGDNTLEKNLKFIANALDEKSSDTPRNVIRKYFANDFFKDHCKKYQNRPIYWQFDSGKYGGFKALMYLHRYDENTIPTARLSFLHDIQWKYEREKERLEKFVENSSIASEKAKAKKELELIGKQILECKTYDEILNHASNMRIDLDLDDGVKVNYQKFQNLDGDKDKNILSTYLKFKEKE